MNNNTETKFVKDQELYSVGIAIVVMILVLTGALVMNLLKFS